MIFLSSSATILKESLARDIQPCIHSRSRAPRLGLSLSIFFILFQELLQSIPSHLEKGNKYLETFTKSRGIERLVCHGNKLGTSRTLVSIHLSMHTSMRSTSICLVGSLCSHCGMQGMMKAQQEGQKVKVKVTQSCPTLCDPMEFSRPE